MSVTLKPWGVYNMTKTLQELLAERSLDSQARIQQLAEQLFLENQLYRIREELEISQKELAQTLGIKQPSLSAIENRGNDLKISTMKKYVEAMGGKLRIDVELPTGKHIGFTV
ncbi:Antitoxin HigA [Psychrobacter piechaudii]|jgi:DNA-binding XRE family transcriptional regulator|uniref:Antitoxin HigA n=2 Tax=Psychrobacter TaxID=497 RepID=A0A1R4GYA4_9GAMM|nr:Antitoxin HigA [Psychrobacter piechaudii]